MIGENLSPILEEIEYALWDFEAQEIGQPNFTDNGFRAAIKIFMAAMMDRTYSLQSTKGLTLEQRGEEVIKLGNQIKDIVKTYTGVDTLKMYDK